MNGAQAMIKCLEAEGIDIIFGYPGVAIAPFYDAMYDSSIKHVLTRQEQAAGHAASGYARISRKPAVCCTSSGPGATNIITSLATAYADSIPVIVITGQVNSELLGRDVFQEADMRGATQSFVKYSYLVKNVDDIPRIFKEAFFIANTGRKGPVLIDIPVDVQMKELSKEFKYPDSVDIRGYKPNTKGNPQQMAKVIAAINNAERPLICAGGGVILGNGENTVREFCEKYQIPLVHTMMGIGVMAKAHPMYYGMLGNNDSDHEKERRVIPPFTLEPAAGRHVFSVCEHKASCHHGDDKYAHDDGCRSAVLNETVDYVEREVQDRDLNDIPHVLVEKEPSGEDAQQLHRSKLHPSDARCCRKHQDAHIERNEYRHKTLFEESLKIILFRLQARIKSVT